MAICVATWELGEGMGHLAVFRPIVNRLLNRGHKVIAIVRDVIRVDAALQRREIEYLQAPQRFTVGSHVDAPVTFPQVLANVGFGRYEELRSLFGAWLNLYNRLSPDLFLFDHSPIAMLAARGLPGKRVVVGTGFEIPPDGARLPSFLPWREQGGRNLEDDEQVVLDNANRVLRDHEAPELLCVSELFSSCDATILATFQELDHYPVRKDGHYWGCWPNQGGVQPKWPAGTGPKVFAYLKPFPNIVKLLEVFREWQLPALVCFDGPHERIDKFFRSDMVVVTNQPFDLFEVGKTADIAVITGGHGSTASLLLSGVPLLILPNHGEQEITARNVQKLGAGLMADPKEIRQIQIQLKKLLTEPEVFRNAARRFAHRYEGFDAAAQVERAASLAVSLIEIGRIS